MRLSALKRGYAAFEQATTFEGRVFLAIFAVLVAWVALTLAYDWASTVYKSYRAAHLSPAEHFQAARDLCHYSSGTVTCVDADAADAIRHLQKIPPSTAHYAEASKLLSLIQAYREKQRLIQQEQEQKVAALLAKQQAERARLLNQTEDESREQMLRNILGQAHDAFTCGTSTDGLPIISFDYGHYWWTDDGRCAKSQEKERQQRAEKERQEQIQAQRKRDQDAEISSYWPTTLRVDTDMDSFWLPNEERTCQTYPDTKGRVAVVACNSTGSHHDHNIPVKFWGGVDRDTVSNWKCRRESDEFVCRAID